MLDLIKGKTILITGGTGFLGIALTKELLKFNPKSIRLFSRDEVKHHKTQEVFENHPLLRNLIGDVRDYPRLLKATKGVDIVIHAAAFKRLDIMEYNVEEVIKTNILGTLNVVNASLENNVEKVIFISTDKACSPVNTYGACKFVSERIVTETNYNKGNAKTIFTCVRYGNVLESTGSVIPFFENKIKAGLNIPLTHPEMTRFIITPNQAVDLIFNALRYGEGGEIFIPQLPSMKIVDLIDILKEKYGKPELVAEVIGIRPGEKIHELMLNEAEISRTYKFNNLLIITSLIQKYQEGNASAIPYYIKEGKLLRLEEIKEYSSKDSVLPKEEVSKLLKSYGIV